jgi:hypothetical protein
LCESRSPDNRLYSFGFEQLHHLTQTAHL